MGIPRRHTTILGAWLAAMLAVPAAAAATPLLGLTAQGCLSSGLLAGCTTLNGQLDSPGGLAISPDGANAYVMGGGSDTLLTLKRDPATGALSPQGCVSNDGLAGCGGTYQGKLDGPNDVVVSPDGGSVYVVAVTPGTVVTFARDRATGALTPQGCFSNADLAGCTTLAGRLSGASSVAASADGSSVYVTAQIPGTLVSFTRDPATGALAPQGCFSNVAITGCDSSLAGKLGAGADVAVAADGASVHAAYRASGTLVSFTRTASGALTFASCFSNAALAGCATQAGQLNRVRAVTVSPDGANVYAAGDDNAAMGASQGVLNVFKRTSGGALTFASCFSDDALAACTTLDSQLYGANDVTVSPDGSSLYVATFFSSRLTTFARTAATGALAYESCFTNVVRPGCSRVPGQLDLLRAVTVSPDGAGVYVTAQGSSALVTFARELAPVCRASTSAGAAGAAQAVPLDCRDPNGDPLAFAVASAPRSGTLGAFDAVGRTVAYTPAAGFSGLDDFAVTATSDGKTTAPVNVSVIVAPPPAVLSPGPGVVVGSPLVTPPVAVKPRVAFVAKKLSVRRGKALTVAFTVTTPGVAKLTVRKGTRTRASLSVKVEKAGRASVVLSRAASKKLKAGKYAIRLAFTPTAARRPLIKTLALTVRP